MREEGNMLLISLMLLAAAETAAPEGVWKANCPEPVVEGNFNEIGAVSSSDIQAPTVKTRVEPKYPADIDKALKVKARVDLKGTVDIDGVVGDVSTLKCTVTKQGATLGGEEKATYCKAFTAAAEASFSNWRYEPAVKNGKAVCVHETASFSFGRPK